MKPILEIEGISKRYRIGADLKPYNTIRESLFSAFRPGKRQEKEVFWALQDISFKVMPGESIGIIGRNGAGKSTLLKILSRITPPTKGRIISRGRIASLLEVGTGFHPELTGKENIFLNGSILGMSRQEVRNKFDEIVDFSGVEKFLDTPLKHYSSGMQLRLAFSVAAFLEPEILMIDEVLAVGDAEFQKKCIGKMNEVTNEGRTVLFVSHNLPAVSNLCNRGIFLSEGILSFNGNISDTIHQYQNMYVSKSDSLVMPKGTIFYNKIINNNAFGIQRITLRDDNNNQINFTSTYQSFYFDIEYFSPLDIVDGSINLFINSFAGNVLLRFATRPDMTIDFTIKKGINKISCFVKKLTLTGGAYTLSFGIAIPFKKWYYKTDNFCRFEVEPTDVYNSGFKTSDKYATCFTDYKWVINNQD